MKNSVDILIGKIEDYKSKFYKNRLIKGLLIATALIVSLFIFINFIEYFGRLSTPFRGLLLFSFIAASLYTIAFLIVNPLLYLFHVKKGYSVSQAAEDIGKFFPEIGDKLLNTLQLSSHAGADNSLLLASIEQKSQKLRFYNFSDAINIQENKKYLKYTIPPLLALLLISAISPSFFKSSERIINFREEFEEEAPFEFMIQNEDLNAFRNEDFELKLHLDGNTLPEEVYLTYNDRRFKMDAIPESNGRDYSYVFNKMQQGLEFNFLASGFESKPYEIKLLNRPELLSFDVIATYPSYLGKQPERLENVGNLIVPQGTSLKWLFRSQFADSLAIVFNEGKPNQALKNNENEFSLARKLMQSSDYKIVMKNNQITNDEKISYYINVIPDNLPKIQLEQVKDSVLFNYIALGGNISDDYGISDFKLKYRVKNKEEGFKTINIGYNKNQISQTFFHQFDIRSLKLEQDDQLEYYLELWDNDGVQGPKSVKTGLMSFELPSSRGFDQEVEKQTEETEDQLEKLLKKSKELEKSLEEIDKNLKSKKEIDFNDKKKLEDLLKKRKEMMEELRQLQQQFDKMQEKQSRFQEQNPETQKKLDQLQQMLNEIMKDENSELFKQMEEMLEKNETQKMMEQLQKMKEKDRNLDREIDRTLKLFKNLQLKQKVEQLAKELEKLAEKQEDLAEKTGQNENQQKNEELKKEQEKLNKEFDEKKEKMKDVEELSKELNKDMDMQKEEQKEVDKQQDKAKEDLEKNDSKSSSKSQKKAAKSMKNMAAQMAAEMQSAEMKQLDMDMDALRAILENLVKLSHDQESLMKNFKNISKSDPRYVELSQHQLKLVDDAKVIEDSLYTLAQRVMQIEAFITKEVTQMKNSMDQSIQLLRDRNVPRAAASQQFSMTSMNNLALMLSDTFKQMQDMMAMSMPGSGKGGKSGEMPMPGLGEQQQKLNQKMKGLGQNGQNASEMSKDLAKIANEQAKIRKQLQEMQEQMNGTEMGKKLGNELKEIEKEMDKNENEMVNKRINPELLKRQMQLETRLLQAEKAIKEQELDPKRKSKTALEFERPSPPELEKFMQDKLKQQELIRTTPPGFTPYYKQETDKYFRRLN